MLPVIIAISVVSILCYILWDIRDRKWQVFASAPHYPILGHAVDFLSGDHLGVLMRYNKEYGKIVLIRTGPVRKVLLVSDYDLVEYILGGTKVMKKSEDYKNLKRWLGTGLLTTHGEKWKSHRHLLTPAFHYKILEEFVEVFEKNSKILVQKLEQEIDKDKVDVGPLIALCTLDIICESAMGTSINAQEDSHSDYVKSVDVICEIIVERAFSFYKTFDTLYYFTKDFQREMEALKILHAYSQEVIETRRKIFESPEKKANHSKKKKAFLDLLLETRANNPDLTLGDIQQEVDTFMFAGHDTTSSAVSFLLYVLTQHQDIQQKLFEEQQEIFGDTLEGDGLTLQQLKDMSYLELVIKETLRVYPAVPMIGREVEEDFEFKGVIYPKGVTLTIFPYAMHRDPEFFEDPDRFWPERFENAIRTKPYSYIPFSAGSRNCIGQKYAMAEMKGVASRLIRSFRFLPCGHKIQPAAKTVLASKNGIFVKLERRMHD